jgi:hypothetical protein
MSTVIVRSARRGKSPMAIRPNPVRIRQPTRSARTPMSERPDTFEQAIVRLSAAVTEAFNRGDVKTCAASYVRRVLCGGRHNVSARPCANQRTKCD